MTAFAMTVAEMEERWPGCVFKMPNTYATCVGREGKWHTEGVWKGAHKVVEGCATCGDAEFVKGGTCVGCGKALKVMAA